MSAFHCFDQFQPTRQATLVFFQVNDLLKVLKVLIMSQSHIYLILH